MIDDLSGIIPCKPDGHALVEGFASLCVEYLDGAYRLYRWHVDYEVQRVFDIVAEVGHITSNDKQSQREQCVASFGVSHGSMLWDCCEDWESEYVQRCKQA
ncbi:MAG: hypothetical protein RhofKO_20150 [Rhodothermales bacterium]